MNHRRLAVMLCAVSIVFCIATEYSIGARIAAGLAGFYLLFLIAYEVFKWLKSE